MKKVKYIFGVLLTGLILTGAGCANVTVKQPQPINVTDQPISNQPSVQPGQTTIQAEVKPPVNQPVNLAPSVDLNAPDQSVKSPAVNSTVKIGETKTFNLTMQKFSFTPNIIEVNEGDKVVVNATAVDASHGFSVPDLGVNLIVPQGQTLSTTFIASKAGTYTFRCSVYCGLDHANMKGTLIVK